jgi:GTPase
MFADRAKIYVAAGDGGNGCISFRREKGVPRGGPNGGSGGRGGSIFVVADSSYHTLVDQRYHQRYQGERGGHGQGKSMQGRDGQDLFIKVPCGTLVVDEETGKTLADLTDEGQRVLVAKGGKGGRGNAHFATSTRQTPRIAEPGEKGERRTILLELKLLADVGLVGLPNSGKSTLLSAITSAHPRIASYPFTTLAPNLGVVKLNTYRYAVVADIPGLVEGAASGVGLGNQFLRHIERTRFLLRVIDISREATPDPLRAYQILQEELSAYNPRLIERPQAIVGNKIDLPLDPLVVGRLGNFCEKEKIPLFFISALTREGLSSLLSYLTAALSPRGGSAPS